MKRVAVLIVMATFLGLPCRSLAQSQDQRVTALKIRIEFLINNWVGPEDGNKLHKHIGEMIDFKSENREIESYSSVQQFILFISSRNQSQMWDLIFAMDQIAVREGNSISFDGRLAALSLAMIPFSQIGPELNGGIAALMGLLQRSKHTGIRKLALQYLEMNFGYLQGTSLQQLEMAGEREVNPELKLKIQKLYQRIQSPPRSELCANLLNSVRGLMDTIISVFKRK